MWVFLRWASPTGRAKKSSCCRTCLHGPRAGRCSASQTLQNGPFRAFSFLNMKCPFISGADRAGRAFQGLFLNLALGPGDSFRKLQPSVTDGPGRGWAERPRSAWIPRGFLGRRRAGMAGSHLCERAPENLANFCEFPIEQPTQWQLSA